MGEKPWQPGTEIFVLENWSDRYRVREQFNTTERFLVIWLKVIRLTIHDTENRLTPIPPVRRPADYLLAYDKVVPKWNRNQKQEH